MTWLRAALSGADLAVLDALAPADGRPGARLDPGLADLGPVLARLRALLAQAGRPGARIVRMAAFVKDAGANWSVPWHQDRIIAVRARHDLPGFAAWSLKSGTWHCEPPLAILSGMAFLRLHLDDCDARNGAMAIARGSEAEGIVPSARAGEVAARYPEEVCAARRGDVQVLPMLVLHRSLPARDARPRRALRLDVAWGDLPPPLAWAAG